MKKVSEGQISITAPDGVFYNPEMELCRDVSSLAVGAIGEDISAIDAMCASGVRGLRYKKENRNVKLLALVDMSKRAIEYAKKNAAANKIKCTVAKADACDFLRKKAEKFNFVELDPFGSPAPFLYDAARSFADKKTGYISTTATDMAVLCGAAHAACLKNYGATPLDNEFCHENAVRILIAKVIQTCAQFNIAAQPIYTLSHRHYVKIIFELKKSADLAVDAMKKIGFLSYCPACCWREASRLPRNLVCPGCSHQLQIAGPLYIESLWDEKLLEKMVKLNSRRKYIREKEIEKLLRTQLAESKINSYAYYDLHTLAKKMKKPIKSMDDALDAVRKAGFVAERTHFCPTAIRTGAPHKEVLRMVLG